MKMTSFTKNFFIIMFSGLIMMTMLSNNIFGNVSASENKNIEKTEQPSKIIQSTPDMLSPDEINVNEFFPFGIGGSTTTNAYQSLNNIEQSLTTLTTTMTTSSTKPTTTTTVFKNENDIDVIKNPNYQSKYYIVVYTGNQSVVVYGKDDSGAYNKIIKTFTCSTGNKSSSPTRKGVYRLRTKYRWKILMGDVWGQYSCGISDDYLFHSVPYAQKDPSSLFDASYDNLGKAVSHGCIRLCVRDCKWIYDNVPIGTQVNVVWISGPAGSGYPKRKSGKKYSGWDPSDKWSEGNPYFSEAESTTTTSKPATTTTTTTTTTAAPSTETTTVKTTTSTTTTTVKTTTTTVAPSSETSTSRSRLWSTQTTAESN